MLTLKEQCEWTEAEQRDSREKSCGGGKKDEVCRGDCVTAEEVHYLPSVLQTSSKTGTL